MEPARNRERTPDWIVDGLRQVAGELKLYARTSLEFTLHPRRFAGEWASGARHALNPMGFLATTLGVLGPALVGLGRITHEDDAPSSFRADVLGTITPFAFYLLLGTIEHAILRLFGSRRRLRDSWAMALYAGGGPSTTSTLVVCALAAVVALAGGPTHINSFVGVSPAMWLLIASAVGAQLFFLTSLALSLWGLHQPHGIRLWHVLLATVGALVASAILFGVLDPPGKFGIHLVVRLRKVAGHWGYGFSLGD
jgi:hypothetical protein